MALTETESSNANATRLESASLVCFVHIPKTAGTTFRRILSDPYDGAEIFPNDEEILNNRKGYPAFKVYDALTPSRRAALRLVAGHYRFAELQPRFPYAQFVTFLRDPIDRTLSEVLHLKRHVERFASSTEEEIVATLARGGGRFGLNAMSRYLALIYPFIRKPLSRQDVAVSAMRTIRDMAAIGIAERFDDSIALMTRTMGWHFGKSKKLTVTPQKLTKARRTELEAIIRPYLGIDQMVYDFACQEFARRLKQADTLPATPMNAAGFLKSEEDSTADDGNRWRKKLLLPRVASLPFGRPGQRSTATLKETGQRAPAEEEASGSRNTGIAVLNPEAMRPGEAAVYCVLGLPRGGTTMTAKLLQEAGVFMGVNMPVTAEDPDFAKLLKEETPDTRKFRDLVAKRHATYTKWGFKAPYRNHWSLLSSVENIRFVVVFRDMLSIANRNKISVDANLLASLRSNIFLQKTIVDFIGSCKRPALLFSYEKALLSPIDISKSLLDFVETPCSDEAMSALLAVIQPDEPKYVAAQDPKQHSTIIHVDVARRDRVAGWARRANGAPVSLAVELSGTIVGSVCADRPRQDLEKTFGGGGQYGFDLAIDTSQAPSSGAELVIRNTSDGSILYRKTLD
ncbi:hypothetical protein D3874_22920 [Oleomonas cavernae]|uniref:Sulfotransferase family protein n=1 Tax=Oleomonas cavernae TaxID=2320859 RepID=A0A418WHP6_9PROT|nr:sulfotransferase family 2 domain-containing protein [Oleomonas cavernae]RJF89472.1 hypothetical protein D3874_22920 [Oleomonas cavernae]